MFDDLSEGDLKPLKQVHRPGESSNPYQPSSSLGDRHSGPYAGELASLGKRFLGAFVDQMVYLVAIVVGFLPMLVLGNGNGQEPTEGFIIGLLAVAGIALLVPTIINAVMITKSGQSIGKKAVGIRIVQDPDRQLPGFVKGVLVRSYVTALLTQVVPFFGLIDVLFIFGEERKCVHDKMAHTIVINA
jgi:uncharacterized RDD family membrane protein YckC